MTGKVTIWNMALAFAGVSRKVGSETENSAEAIHCRAFYDQARDTTLRAFDWPWARAYGPLVLRADVTPLAPYKLTYAGPADCIAFRRIEKDATERLVPFSISLGDDGGLMIHTDKTGARGVWTRAMKNPERYDPTFVRTLAWLLASDLAVPLTKDIRRQQFALTSFQEWGRRAEVAASNEGATEVEAFKTEPDWISSR